MIPVTTVCYASINSIKKVAATVISPHFHADESSSIEVFFCFMICDKLMFSLVFTVRFVIIRVSVVIL